MITTTEHTTVVTSGEVKCVSKLCAANDLTRRYTYWAAGLGIVPVPVFDLAAVLAVQVKLVYELSHLYGVRFFDNKAKHFITVLIAGLGGGRLVAPVLASLLKVVPIVGTVNGFVALSLTGGAFTYALGKVFTSHFESGGTLLDFDPEKSRAYFAELVKEGQKAAADAKAAAAV